MTVLKWLADSRFARLCRRSCRAVFRAAVAGLSRSRRRLRTSPQAAGFPEAEEHVLTTADGEKVIVWHVPAKPGHPVCLYFPRQWRFSRRLRRPLSRHDRRRHRARRAVLSGLCRLERTAERARDCCRMPLRPMPSRRRDTARTNRRLGLFARHRRRGGAGGRAAGRKADPGSALYFDRGRRGVWYSGSCRYAG